VSRCCTWPRRRIRGRGSFLEDPGKVRVPFIHSERRRQVQDLLSQGLTRREIADRLGFSYQAVHSFFKYSLRDYPARCRACKGDLNRAVARPRDDRRFYCLACLARRPAATFGQHLKAYRLARGLTHAELCWRTGVSARHVSCLECDDARPTWKTQAKLFEALGVRLVFDTDVAPA
jgi:transcriptional regulator with XRE-family HTH domain